MAQHTGHDPGEQQRAPFFRCCLKAGKRIKIAFSGFLWFSLHPSNLIYAHLDEYLFEVEEAETHACLNGAERNLCSLGNF